MAGQVSSNYRHRRKTARFITLTKVPGALLKVYALEEAGLPVTMEMEDLALRHVARVAPEMFRDDCGFLIIHRCGQHFHFAIINTWRGDNEVWEAVHHIDRGMTDFAPFPPAYQASGALRSTFCVWEMGITAHEAKAWSRYLMTARDAAALATWQSDVFNGEV